MVLRDALDGPTARQWAERTVQAVDSAFPDGTSVADWETCKLLLPHAQRCAELVTREDLSSSAAASLLLNMGNYLREQAWYQEAEPLYQRALWIREQQVGSDHPEVACALNKLAFFYTEQGKYAQAEPLHQRALQIWEQRFGSDHPEVACALNGLALLYRDQGK
jgi:tetratricopeptide (TPR) repeat protein